MNNLSSPDNHNNHPAALTPLREFINNLPYIAMIVLGCAIFLIGFSDTSFRWLWSFLYLIYGLVGALWIILFLCPYCNFYGTRMCPCGYGRFASKFRARKDSAQFTRQFRRHIYAIVPLWFIPPVVGIFCLVKSYSLLLLILIIAFSINSFIILPLYSRRTGCVNCPQKQSCPWMNPQH